MHLVYKLKLICRFLFDKNIPIKEKWWIIIPTIYILSPIDLIPAPILGFSIIDDLVMFLYLLAIVNTKASKYYGDGVGETSANHDDVIDNVEYKVDEDKRD